MIPAAKNAKESTQAPRQEKPMSHDGAAPDSGEFDIADLPQEDINKLQRLEEELRADTGEEVVVIAYEKEKEPPLNDSERL